MIDYLYYRFYRLWLHSSVSEGATFLAMLLFSVMLSTNVLTAWGILTQYGIIDYPSDTSIAVWQIFLQEKVQKNYNQV